MWVCLGCVPATKILLPPRFYLSRNFWEILRRVAEACRHRMANAACAHNKTHRFPCHDGRFGSADSPREIDIVDGATAIKPAGAFHVRLSAVPCMVEVITIHRL